jgi:hypothetical protein
MSEETIKPVLYYFVAKVDTQGRKTGQEKRQARELDILKFQECW